MGKQIVAFGVACCICLSSSAATIDQNWDSRFVFAPGLNGKVFSMTVLGTNLYVGGWFSSAGVENSGGIARWDGNAWHSVGGGINGIVFALETDGTNLYVGGDFDSAGGVATTNIARWNGTNWSSLGGLDLGDALNAHEAVVYCLKLDGTNLFAGGTFFRAGGVLATNVARWDGNSWRSLGDGLGTAGALDDFFAVYDIAKHGTNLYATGRFPASGASGVTNLARWNGSLWEQVGDGLQDGQAGYYWRNAIYYGYGQALCSTPRGLLIGGDFSIGSQNITNLILWDGTNWSSANSGGAPVIVRIRPDGTNQIVLGEFVEIGGTTAHGVARLSGGVWQQLGQGVVPTGIAAARVGTNLYVGGDFQIAGGQSAGNIAQWNGVDWAPLISGETTAPSDQVTSLEFGPDDSLYVGGSFVSAGEEVVNGIARYDGTNWHSLGIGFPHSGVSRLTWVGTNLFVVGSANVFGWDGQSWSMPGGGLGYGGYSPIIDGFAGGNSNLFVAGYFTSAGGASITNLACWDGNQWKAIPMPPSTFCASSVSPMTTSGDRLVVCQQGNCFFGDPKSVQIMNWDGDAWTAVTSTCSLLNTAGLYPQISQILCVDSNIFLAGQFVITNECIATNIVVWDGTNWSGLGFPYGLGASVAAIAHNGTNLFLTLNGSAESDRKVVKWNGSSWQTLGTGPTWPPFGPSLSSLAVRGRDLYVGGWFSSMGGKPANNLALWHDFPAVTLAARGWQPSEAFGLRIIGGKDQPVHLESSTNLQDWIDIGAQLPDMDTFDFEDSVATPAAPRFYRLRLIP